MPDVLSDDEIVSRGREIYDRELRPLLEPNQNGRIVLINPRNGDYAVGDDATDVGLVMRARYPGEVFYEARVGEEYWPSETPWLNHVARIS
jgi:hypothetical protein